MNEETRGSGDVDVRATVALLEVEPAPAGVDSLLVWASLALTDELAGSWDPIGDDAARASEVVSLAVEDFPALESLVLCEPPKRGALQRWRERQPFEQPSPDRATWTHHDDLGWIRPQVWAPVRTFEGWDAEVKRQDQARAMRARVLLAEYRKHNKGKVYDDVERRTLADGLGARIRGDRARDVPCPSCGKRSVWFYLSMVGHTFGGAACKHRNSCGWAGHLRALEG